MLALAFGLWLLGLGGNGVNAPVALGGPMRLDFGPVVSLGALLAGLLVLAALPLRWARPGWAMAAAILLATMGRNFYLDPPLDDGAWRQMRTGGFGGEDGWPASPVVTVLGACPLALAIAGARNPAALRSRWVPALAAAATLAAGWAYPAYVAALRDLGRPWPFGWLLPAGCVLACVVTARRRGRLPGLALGFAAVMGVLSLATWAIYVSVP